MLPKGLKVRFRRLPFESFPSAASLIAERLLNAC